MKITSAQLRRIIKEEVKNLTEAADFASALASGSLAGVGRGTIAAALTALSDADFKKLSLAFNDAVVAKKSGAKKAGVSAAAAALDPATLASKLQDSLKTMNWTWTGYAAGQRGGFDKQEAVKAALDAALGAGAGDEFEAAVIYAAGDDDTFRRMSPEEADRAYVDSVKKIKQMAAKLVG